MRQRLFDNLLQQIQGRRTITGTPMPVQGYENSGFYLRKKKEKKPHPLPPSARENILLIRNTYQI